jgi:hypothetical protein
METRAISYGGLIPAYYLFGAASAHYLGRAVMVSEDEKVPVLGCECGEWGCWPLLTRVVVDGDAVIWTDFEQPHRRDRDYSGFGPFIFDRRAYEEAVADIAQIWAAESPP